MKQKAENIENIISREIKRTRRKIKIQRRYLKSEEENI
jgi:hypothetical protein